jgi:ubiquinone/menaquinone biosynthesis C-methylase UbiE
VTEEALSAAIYQCPACRRPLQTKRESPFCSCGARVRSHDGILLLAREAAHSAEGAYYEQCYAVAAQKRRSSDLRLLRYEWESLYYPMNADVLRRVGDIGDKTVLLLGNGASDKELYFLTQKPRLLIVSDLSVEGLRLVRRQHQLEDSHYPVEWAVIDATRLPILDRAIDVVYGYAFVHHLSDTAGFIKEVARVLRDGGRCVFMDNRRSPAWQRAKLGVLRPLMSYFHRRGSISPEDLRATLSGWHSEEELHDMITAAGGKPFFERSFLFHYLFTRASERLPPRAVFSYLSSQAWLLRALIRLDTTLSRFERIRRNQIRLVWGFEILPPGPGEAAAQSESGPRNP